MPPAKRGQQQRHSITSHGAFQSRCYNWQPKRKIDPLLFQPSFLTEEDQERDDKKYHNIIDISVILFLRPVLWMKTNFDRYENLVLIRRPSIESFFRMLTKLQTTSVSIPNESLSRFSAWKKRRLPPSSLTSSKAERQKSNPTEARRSKWPMSGKRRTGFVSFELETTFNEFSPQMIKPGLLRTSPDNLLSLSLSLSIPSQVPNRTHRPLPHESYS